MRKSIVLALFIASCWAAAPQTAKRITPAVDTPQISAFSSASNVGIAVLVGVGKYGRYSNLGELRYPAADVDVLASAFKSQRYSVITLKDSDATRGSIMNAIYEAGHAISADIKDGKSLTIIFFFSGHGFKVGDKNFLATFDSAIDSKQQVTGLSVDDVQSALKETKAPRRVLLIDACRNEVGGKRVGGNADEKWNSFQASAGTRALLSAEAGHISYEDESLKHGVFTYYLVEGLQGRAARSDGLVTFEGLAAYVTDQVKNHSLSTGQVQVPYESGEHSGDFLLARLGPVTNPPPKKEDQPGVNEQETITNKPKPPDTSVADLQDQLDGFKPQIEAEKKWWARHKPSVGDFRPQIQIALAGLDDNMRKAESALAGKNSSSANSAISQLSKNLATLQNAH